MSLAVVSLPNYVGPYTQAWLVEEEEIYLPGTITILNKKNTVLMLARSRLPEMQKAIYAGRQHC